MHSPVFLPHHHLYNSGLELQIPTGMSFLIIFIQSNSYSVQFIIVEVEIDLNNLFRFHPYGQQDVASF